MNFHSVVFLSSLLSNFTVIWSNVNFFALFCLLNCYMQGDFEIHVICGVNPYVSKGARSHVNFWATPKRSNIAGATPRLFFAEFNNDDKEEESLCFSVSSASIDSGMFSVSHQHFARGS